MQFRISDTFTDSLTKLNGQEQKAVKTTAFDLQLDPANPGMQFHRIDHSKDGNFWSVRVSRDLRLIVHKTEASFLLCYAGHHDDAYRWAERRKIERHPRTGAAQLVELRETVEETTRVVPAQADAEPQSSAPLLFPGYAADDLLQYGVPEEWLADVLAATEETLFTVAEKLPQEAAEALLELATGGTPARPASTAFSVDPFEHPDAERRFRVLTNAEELERALEYPWEKWTVFLHPSQRQLVERDASGPTRVAGSAGTGKTVVALHRAVHLAKTHPEAKVLITTFSRTLANALRLKLSRLAGKDTPLSRRIDVHAVEEISVDLHSRVFGMPTIASDYDIANALTSAANGLGETGFTKEFLLSEWREVVDAWQLRDWEAYRDVARLGRKTRIGGRQREKLWAVFERVWADLGQKGLATLAEVQSRVANRIVEKEWRPYEYVVVDEAQDVGVAELRLLAALGAGHPDGLFLAGDLGQRIFQQPFSWKTLGVDIRGRSHTLRINNRTSHQIRVQADRLLPTEVSDVDGVSVSREGTQSVFNGPAPVIDVLDDEDAEVERVAGWIKWLEAEGVHPEEIGVFVRTRDQMDRARQAVDQSGNEAGELSNRVEIGKDQIAIGTMHLAKGLEFKAVAVMACDDEILPLQSRVEAVGDMSDLDEVYATERHLLYVACTRARDYLLVTGVDPASEFLDDLN